MNYKHRYEMAMEIAYKFLKTSLPKDLCFHSINHTFGDVLLAAEYLTDSENLSDYQKYLLLIAVLFHDSGYSKVYKHNEVIGVEIARELLSDLDFSQEELDYIERIIIATEVNFQDGYPQQNPNDDLLEKIMCDADLDNLGRDDFFDLSVLLIKELESQGSKIDIDIWWKNQYKFLVNHQYFTASQRNRRNEGKAKNILKVKEMIKE